MCQLSRKYRQSISCGNHITCLSNLCKLERCGIQICIPKLVNQQKEWLRDEFLEGVLSLILRQGCTQKASIASHTRRKISMTCKVKHFGSHYLSQNNVQETGMAALLYKEIIVIHNQEVKKKNIGLVHYRKDFTLFSQKFVQLPTYIGHIYPGSPPTHFLHYLFPFVTI